MRFSFERTIRTPSSEQWVAYNSLEETVPTAQLDVHYDGETVSATVLVTRDLAAADLEDLLGDFDDDVVNMADQGAGLSYVVFRGAEVGSFVSRPDAGVAPAVPTRRLRATKTKR